VQTQRLFFVPQHRRRANPRNPKPRNDMHQQTQIRRAGTFNRITQVYDANRPEVSCTYHRRRMSRQRPSPQPHRPRPPKKRIAQGCMNRVLERAQLGLQQDNYINDFCRCNGYHFPAPEAFAAAN